MSEAVQTAAAYGIAHGGKSLLWGFFNSYFLYFAIYGAGLDPLRAASISAAFVLADVVVDLAVATALQRWGMSGNGMAKWVLLATPFAAGALVLLFAPLMLAPGAQGDSLIGLLTAGGFIFRAAFSLIDVPLNAAIGRFTYSSRMRNLGSAMRSLGGLLAGLAIGAVTAVLLEQNGRLTPERFWIGAMILAGCAAPLVMIGFACVDRTARRWEVAIAISQRDRPKTDVSAFLTVGLLALTGTNVSFLVVATQLDDAFIYLSQGAWPEGPRFSLITITLSFAYLCGAALWLWLATHWEKRTTIFASLVALALVTALFPFLPKTTIAVLSFAFVLALSSGANALIWSLLPDLVDQASARSGKPAHAIVVGVFALIGKLSIAASQLLSGALLAASGFPANPDYDLYTMLVIAVSIVGTMLAAIPLLFIRMSHDKHASMVEDLLRDQTESGSGESRP